MKTLGATYSFRHTFIMRLVLTLLPLVFLAMPSYGQSPSTDRLKRKTEWEMFYAEGISADEYAKELDYFGIEIGVIGKDGKIQYAKNFSGRKAEKRIGKQELENRTSIGWKRGTLHALDRKMLARAGINTQDKTLLHYYSHDVEQQLFKAEADFAHRKPDEIKRTRFQVQPKAKDEKGYHFVVIEQDYFMPQAESTGKLSENKISENHE